MMVMREDSKVKLLDWNGYELNLIKHSLEVHLKNCEVFKRGNYRLTKVEEEKIDRKIDDIKEILIKLKDITM